MSVNDDNVKRYDLLKVIGIAFVAAALFVAFGFALHLSGMLKFPTIGPGEPRGGYERYFMDALDYRERRLTLSLVLRTFITSFSFIIGLALCTQGGIFILRQVKAFTSVSTNFGKAADTHKIVDGDRASKPSNPLFSFASYSPGVVFMAGGVFLMVATQYFAIKIESPEIVARGDGGAICYDSAENSWGMCVAKQVESPEPSEVSPYCQGPMPDENCSKKGEDNE